MTRFRKLTPRWSKRISCYSIYISYYSSIYSEIGHECPGWPLLEMISGWACRTLEGHAHYQYCFKTKVRVNRDIGTSRYACHSLSVVLVYLPNLLHGGACRTRNMTEAGADIENRRFRAAFVLRYFRLRNTSHAGTFNMPTSYQ